MPDDEVKPGHAQPQVEQEVVDDSCIVCMDAPRTRVLNPCKHAIMSAALYLASSQLCPMCRAQIDSSSSS